MCVCVCADKPTDAVGWPNVKVGMDRVDRGRLPAPQCKDRALNVERITSTDGGDARVCVHVCTCVCISVLWWYGA